jgi:multidrug transporter EmrE-like cation transporter
MMHLRQWVAVLYAILWLGIGSAAVTALARSLFKNSFSLFSFQNSYTVGTQILYLKFDLRALLFFRHWKYSE